MHIRPLVLDSLKQGLMLNIIFFIIFRKRLHALAAQLEQTGGGERKRSPFVYNLR